MEAFVKFSEKHFDGITGVEARMKWAERQESRGGEEEDNSLGKVYEAGKEETWSGGESWLRENSLGWLGLSLITRWREAYMGRQRSTIFCEIDLKIVNGWS